MKVLTEKWRREYNTIRPRSSLGYNPPTPETILPRSSGAQRETYTYGLT
ncbi:MAG: transposase [Deltaproteobacteria bacterium]|nr:transposase [Candidatus Zymogenaceae bacterium]